MNKWLRHFLAALFLLLLDGAAMFLFRRFPDFFFPAYRTFSKRWIGFLAWLTSFTGFSVWDAVMVFLLFLLILTFVRMVRKHTGFLSWLAGVLLSVSVLATAAVCGWMLNHYAPPLAEELGYDTGGSTPQQLYDACEYYLLKAGEYAPEAERDSEGHLVPHDFPALAEKAGAAYASLAEDYPVFRGSSAGVKRFTLIGEYLMYNGVIGMFMPLSGEAGVPGSVPPAVMPYTMVHEAAHRLGIASEEEANFAAFIACMDSTEIPFLYSGYYQAFAYCYSSLHQSDPEKALALYHKYDEEEGIQLVQLDRKDTSEIYRGYKSGLKEVSDHINDTYLKTFSEESGIRSYGEVTDDLIAYYLALSDR